MKRYIRLTNGKIFDKTKFEAAYYNELGYLILESEDTNYCIDDEKIIKQADTIEELIEVGDLVVDTKDKYASIVNNLQYANKDLDCDELYTKQGRNYVLVAEKVDGEWRVI